VLLTGCMGRSQVVVQSLPADVLSARCCWLCLALRDQVIDWPCGATRKTGTRMQPAHRTLGTDSGTVATGRLGGGARCWEHNTTPRHSTLLCTALHCTALHRGIAWHDDQTTHVRRLLYALSAMLGLYSLQQSFLSSKPRSRATGRLAQLVRAWC
jgi:hypothetical protein